MWEVICIIIILAALLFATLVIYCGCKISGDISRMEEENEKRA